MNVALWAEIRRLAEIEKLSGQAISRQLRCSRHTVAAALELDNLRAAVLNGSGRDACLHPEFLALCGYFCLQPIACERRDPESKGIVERGVRYVKQNALAGRGEQLSRFEDYLALAPQWRDQVANVRTHETTRERPVDRFLQERALLRALPATPLDTDEVVPAVVNPLARIEFDGNRYSMPPRLARQPVTIRASRVRAITLIDALLSRIIDGLPRVRLAA
jgi:hypothetical protein